MWQSKNILFKTLNICRFSNCKFKGREWKTNQKISIDKAQNFKEKEWQNFQWQKEESNWCFIDNDLLPSIISLKSNSHYTTVNLPLPNQEEITVAFNDLGIENPYLKNFVFNYSTTMEKEDFYNSDGIDDLISAMEKENIIYNSNDIEVQPSYPGGIDEFRKFVARNYKRPNIDRNLKGQVLVQFVVEKDGSLSDIKVLRDLGHGTGAEAVRVVKISKKWNPGILNGKPVPVKYVLPININI